MKSPLDEFLKDLSDDMKHAIEQEDCSIPVTRKDVEKVERLRKRNKGYKSQIQRHRDMEQLFERKFIQYRNKLVSIYQNIQDETLKAEIKHFLEVEQGDVSFNDTNNGTK